MAWLLIFLQADRTDVWRGGMLEKEERPDRDDDLKGKVAVDGMLRCLSRSREAKDDDPKTRQESTNQEA